MNDRLNEYLMMKRKQMFVFFSRQICCWIKRQSF